MGNNKNPNDKQPGEKNPGTFHFNPGNMSGKTIGSHKDEPDRHPVKKQRPPAPKDQKRPK